jgi:hypothetical protein
MIAAAMGEEADVPVCDEVHLLCRSVVTTFRSPSLQQNLYSTDMLKKTFQKANW